MRWALRGRYHLWLVTLAVAMLCVMSGHSALAKQSYFEALYDIPVMPGFDEIKEQAVSFDKPGGRIASAIAASSTVSSRDADRYYSESLPQLGWKKTSPNQYVRDGEQLRYELVENPPLTVVRFTVSPATP